jgi:Ca2+:H+ antiporter
LTGYPDAKGSLMLRKYLTGENTLNLLLAFVPAAWALEHFGPPPMDLQFTPFEVLSVVLAVGVMALGCQDGETNWMEGVQLLAVYLILGIAFYFLPV